MIDPGRWYTKGEVLKLGFGERDLAEARNRGVVNARSCGRFVWINGKELGDWLATLPVKPLSSNSPERIGQ